MMSSSPALRACLTPQTSQFSTAPFLLRVWDNNADTVEPVLRYSLHVRSEAIAIVRRLERRYSQRITFESTVG